MYLEEITQKLNVVSLSALSTLSQDFLQIPWDFLSTRRKMCQMVIEFVEPSSVTYRCAY